MLTDPPRYREIAARFPWAAAVSGTCGCHVHVGVPDRDLAAQVLGRLRPWLPVLLALTANSPVSAGHDNGWLSNRYPRPLEWPAFRPPSPWHSAAGYDRVATSLIRGGAALDPGSVYYLAPLSPRYPPSRSASRTPASTSATPRSSRVSSAASWARWRPTSGSG